MDYNKPYVVVLSSVNFSTVPHAMGIIINSTGINPRECSDVLEQVSYGIPTIINSFSTRDEAEELVKKFSEIELQSEIIDTDIELEKIVSIQEKQIEYLKEKIFELTHN